jgi:hypothetical protein
VSISPDILSATNTVLSLVTALAAIGWGFLMLRLKSEFASRADLAAAQLRVSELGDRVGRLEAELRLLPGHETVRNLTERVGELHSDLAGMGSTLNAMVKNFDAVRHQLDLVQQHLLADRRDRNSR